MNLLLACLWIILVLYFASGAWVALGWRRCFEEDAVLAPSPTPERGACVIVLMDLALTESCPEPVGCPLLNPAPHEDNAHCFTPRS